MDEHSCLKTIGIDDIKGKNVTLMDAHSIKEIASLPVFRILVTRVSDWGNGDAIKELLVKISDLDNGALCFDDLKRQDLFLLKALLFVERLCVHDKFIVDQASLESILLGEKYELEEGFLNEFKDIISLINIPNSIYKETALGLENYCNALRENEIESIFNEMELHTPSKDILVVGDLSSIKDRLLAKHSGFMRNSQNIAPRAVFYFELARHLECSVYMSIEKRKFYSHISSNLKKDALKLVENIFEDKYVNTLKIEINKYFGENEELSIPPLLSYIINQALENDSSLLESALLLRNTSECTSFRELIHKIQQAVIKGNKGLPEIKKHISELAKLAESWSEHIDLKIGSKYKIRKVNLHNIPAIGAIFKLFKDNEWEVKDPILNPQKYVSFISSWYS